MNTAKPATEGGSKCRGISGFFFGHKFQWGGIDSTRKLADHCLRCGMPMGGWKQ